MMKRIHAGIKMAPNEDVFVGPVIVYVHAYGEPDVGLDSDSLDSDSGTTDRDTENREETRARDASRTHLINTRVLERRLESQRNYILELEQALKQQHSTLRQLQSVQNMMIRGRVSEARLLLSEVLMRWPLS